VTVPPNPAQAGGKVTVGGSGFSPGSKVTLALGGRDLGANSTVTDGTGAFTMQAKLSDLKSGEYSIKATDDSNKAASATFNVT
jgi:hypothetical protein